MTAATGAGGEPTTGFDPARLTGDFGDVDAEARACREAAALFDFSFLAVGEVEGAGAADLLGTFAGRSVADLAPGRIRYALRARADGTLVSDLTIWRLTGKRWWLMSGLADDVTDLAGACPRDVAFRDRSARSAVLAVQGPETLRALAPLADEATLRAVPWFGHAATEIAGTACRVARIGYTGERGFEIVLDAAHRDALWDTLAGRARAAGFAAADRLRIEAGLVLFANEFRVPVTAREAGLDRFATADVPPARARLVCARGRSAERPRLWAPPDPIPFPPAPGTIAITSAAWSEACAATLALGYVPADEAAPGRTVVDPTGFLRDAVLVPMPVHDPERLRPRGVWP